MCPLVVLLTRTFYRNDGLSTTCQCRQLKLDPLSRQLNIYCLMTNQTPALLVQRAPWSRAAVMLLQSLYFSRPLPATAIIPDARPPRYIWKSRGPRRSHEKTGDCEQSNCHRFAISFYFIRYGTIGQSYLFEFIERMCPRRTFKNNRSNSRELHTYRPFDEKEIALIHHERHLDSSIGDDQVVTSGSKKSSR